MQYLAAVGLVCVVCVVYPVRILTQTAVSSFYRSRVLQSFDNEFHRHTNWRRYGR